MVKESTCNAGDLQEMQVRSLGWEDPLEKEMATHSSTLAWKIPWTPLCLWELSTVCGPAVCWSFKVSFPTQSPFFDEVSVRSVRGASCSLIGLKCSLLWCGLFGDQLGEKKTNSVTALILKIDKCLFEIKNQSLQPSEVLAFISQSKWAFSTGAKFG